MNIVFVLLPLTFLLGVIFLCGYRWSVRHGQFEDLDTPALRMLADDGEQRRKDDSAR